MLWMLAAEVLASPLVVQNPDGSTTVRPAPPPPPPLLPPADSPTTSVLQWARFMAQVRHVNLVVTDADELSRTPLVLIHAGPEPTSPDDAWEMFVSALDAAGYQVVFVGKTARLVKNADAARSPIPVAGPSLRR